MKGKSKRRREDYQSHPEKAFWGKGIANRGTEGGTGSCDKHVGLWMLKTFRDGRALVQMQ